MQLQLSPEILQVAELPHKCIKWCPGKNQFYQGTVIACGFYGKIGPN